LKILLDHNLDWRISDHLPGHEVRTVLEMAWDTLKNGALLTDGEKSGFSVLITSDKGIKSQQTMQGAVDRGRHHPGAEQPTRDARRNDF
jgi:hypothetical protein